MQMKLWLLEKHDRIPRGSEHESNDWQQLTRTDADGGQIALRPIYLESQATAKLALILDNDSRTDTQVVDPRGHSFIECVDLPLAVRTVVPHREVLVAR